MRYTIEIEFDKSHTYDERVAKIKAACFGLNDNGYLYKAWLESSSIPDGTDDFDRANVTFADRCMIEYWLFR